MSERNIGGATVPETLDVLPSGPRQGRDEEFAAFMTAQSGELLHTAWLLVGDAHQAEELTQAALVRTYAAWNRVRTEDTLRYARRVVANLRIDTWRRRRREVLASPEALPDASETGAQDRVDDRDQLVRALALLTPRQRRIVVLRHLVGLSDADVAADLGVSVGTVKSTASRGLATLRAALAEPSDGSPR
jgi:RNA polymerase sigma-70 factor (sigma-E family)